MAYVDGGGKGTDTMTLVSVSAVSVRYWMTLGHIASCVQGGASADTDGNRQDACNERERENRGSQGSSASQIIPPI